LAQALGAPDPYVAVVVFITTAAPALEKPEPFGSAELFAPGLATQAVQLDRRGQRDTFTPSWEGPPTWRNVPLSPTTRIRVLLSDRDIEYHDPMGTCDINYGDLVTALQARRVHHVKVADQTYQQVLFVGIEVWPE
jgi:hypothetical protein